MKFPRPKSFLVVLLFIAGSRVATAQNVTPQFSENKGQWNSNVLFRMRFNAGALFLEKDQLTFNLVDPNSMAEVHHARAVNDSITHRHAFRVHFEQCNPQVSASGLEHYVHRENYFIGNNSSKWASNVRVFHAMKYQNLYPGIDLQYQGSEGHLEYLFFIQPQADAAKIKMRFEGVDKIYVKDGKLHYSTSVNSISEEKLSAYQTINGKKKEVPCRYVLREKTVSFEFPSGYNHNYELVIDPTLIFSTYTGSSADNFGFTATYDNAGSLYAGGIVDNVGYPTTIGAYDRTFNSDWDVSITKFDPTGASLVYSTYLGGVESENPSSIVVDDQNELIIIGETSSPDFPTTSGAYDRTFNYGVSVVYPYNGQNFTSGTDLFVTKLNVSGAALVGSTFMGGSNNDGLNDDQTFNHPLYYNYGDQFRGEVLVDVSGNIYGVSSTMSTDFPVTSGIFQGTSGGGQDAVVFKLSSDLTVLAWSTYLGGSGSDAGYNLLVNDDNSVYISGGTNSSNFPATGGSLHSTFNGGSADGFVAHISASGNAIVNATYIGTSGYDQSYFIDNDGSGKIYIVGLTDGNYPVTAGVYTNANSGQFITALTPDLSTITLSTVFGRGDGDPDISPTAFLVDNCRNIYVAGWGGPDLISLINNSPPVSTVNGLPLTANAYRNTTIDGQEFYFMVLSKDAGSLVYGTYFGSPNAEDHVDGGTSRFDKNGIIYEAVCAGCRGWDDFPYTPGAWSQNNGSSNCNEGLAKFKFDLLGVDVSVSASPATVGCVPLTVSFSGNGVNAKDFLWDFGDGDTSTLVSPTHTFADTGTYIVTLIGIDSTTCDNEIFSDTSNIPIIVRDDSVSAQFTPVILNSCDSFIVQFNSTSINATNFSWNFGDGNTSTLVSPLHIYTTPGTYDVSLIVSNNTSCNGFDTLVQQVTLVPVITAGISIPDSFGCVPFTASFINTSVGGVIYQWSFGDGDSSSLENPSHTYPDTGTYNIRLIIIDSSSCNKTDTAYSVVRTSNSRVTTAFALDTLATECDSLVVSLTNQSTNYTSLLWDFGDGTTSTDTNPTHTYTTPDLFTITLVASNPNACNESDTSAQIIFQPNNVLADFTADNGCAPYDLSVVNNSLHALSYLWHLSNGQTSTDAIPTLTGLAPGNYSLTLTAYNPLTCNDSSTATHTFMVYDKPVAYFTTSDSLYDLAEDILFTNQSDPGVYLWNFDDGTNSANPDTVHHAYNQQGTYTPCITVTDENGCDSTYCKRLRIDFTEVIDVSNAFSPNGDGSNDIFYIRGIRESISALEFKIYNRWGELVFESTDLNIVCDGPDMDCITIVKGWDGTYKGEKQEMDVYVYTLHVKFKNGQDSGLRKGNITLLR